MRLHLAGVRGPCSPWACAVAAGVIAVAVAGCASGTGSQPGTTATQSGPPHSLGAPPKPRTPKSGRPEHRRPPLRGHPHRGTIPAKMLGPDPQTPFSTDVLYPVRNGWEVSDHRRFTGVYAGAAGNDPSTGAFAIFRQDFVQVTQKLDLVKVAGAGPLKITRAPLGREVRTWAQRRGNLRFTSRNGITGTLHLKGDTVSLR